MHLWIRTPPGRFVVREWDGSCVIFDLLSSDTHACDSVATAVLHELGNDPVDVKRVSRALASALRTPGDADLTTAVVAALENLERLGLAERTVL
jgi:PqqD family protein of HPr-rel-A system